MTLKLANAYPSRQQEVHHRHSHLYLKMVKEFSKLPYDELTRMMEKEAGVAPGEPIDIHALLSPKHEQQEPVEPNKNPYRKGADEP